MSEENEEVIEGRSWVGRKFIEAYEVLLDAY